MPSFAVIDAQAGSSAIAVWIIRQTAPTMVDNTNAVVLDRNHPNTQRVLNNLLPERRVLLTEGTIFNQVPSAMTFEDLHLFADATTQLYDEVLDAVKTYKRKTRNSTLVTPEPPQLRTFTNPGNDVSEEPCLATADYARRLWRDWLEMDRERFRRTKRPRTEETPWIMPEHLNQPDIRPLPQMIADSFLAVPSSWRI